MFEWIRIIIGKNALIQIILRSISVRRLHGKRVKHLQFSALEAYDVICPINVPEVSSDNPLSESSLGYHFE